MRAVAAIVLFLMVYQAQVKAIPPTCKKAYNYTFKGSFNKSRKILKTAQATDNSPCAVSFFQGFNTFMQVVFAEDESLDKALLDSHSVLIDVIEKTEESAFKKYALAELNIQHGMIALRQGNYFGGMFDLRRAYVLVEKNLREYPEFQLSKKPLYTLQALLSNVPDKYKDIVEFFGYKTDQYLALEELDQLQNALKTDTTYGFFRREVEIYRAVLMHKLTDRYEEAYQIVKSQTNDYASNPISCFIRGKMALDSKKTGEAMEVLSHFAGAESPFSYINYDMANACLYSLKIDCLKYFGYFIKQNPGKGLKNDTYLRIAWWYYLKGDTKNADKWLKLIEDPAPGNRERDKVAITEAQILKKTHPKILEARLAFDGGYYEYALNQLQQNQLAILKDDFNTLRFHYQMARLHQDMNHYSEAIASFKLVLQQPYNSDEYYLPVSCFNMAEIYENKLKDTANAISYYKRCIDYKNYPFASSYKYKSQLALERLDKKE
ncbi:tetratricopeptide repeat protein [bacterium]|nr:tetratricopeptide repeat protein [bacterium]